MAETAEEERPRYILRPDTIVSEEEIPGVMRRGPEGLEWEMTGPPWAQALAKELAEIRRLLERGSA